VGRKVLIADDEPNIVLSLEFLMKQAGYEVRTVTNGEAALEAINSDVPDLVLLDVMMPRKDGYEVCETIKANPDWSELKIIMLTARGRDIEREKGMALGADDYVTKPFSTQELVDKVEAIFTVSGG